MAVESSPQQGMAGLPLWTRLLAVPLVAFAVLFGLWFFAGVVSNDFAVSMALTAAWFAAAGATAFYVSRRWRQLMLPVGATFLVTVTGVGGFLAWTSLRDEVVNERVVTGQAASSRGITGGRAGSANVTIARGSFSALAHPTSGEAAVVELSGGERKLTLTNFETDPGPDLFVYLVAGSDPEDVSDKKTLGSLKGNRGNQQYTIPTGVDTRRYDTVVIWCRAFTVAFGAAQLRRA